MVLVWPTEANRHNLAWVHHIWSAPRLFQVRGALASALHPRRGVPAGDPLSMRILGSMLLPWHRLIEMRCPLLRTWRYADNRSLAARCRLADKRAKAEVVQAQCLVVDVLQITTAGFDSPIGVWQNDKKRQLWKLGQRCEHLGFCASQSSISAAFSVVLHDGWQPFLTAVARLPLIPGPTLTRSMLAATCILPKIRWGVPFICPPPRSLDTHPMRGIARSASNSWCVARFWADDMLWMSHFCNGCPGAS